MNPFGRGRGFGRPDYWDAPARREVEGGVAVARPGRVSGEVASELVAQLAGRTTTGVLSRARTYARAGQVVDVTIDAGEARARIQGSDARPYEVVLVAEPDLDADCTCPYGCSRYSWCKHAAALVFVLADLLDRDARVQARWDGAAVDLDEVAVVPGGLVERLLRPVRPVDPAVVWRAAEQLGGPLP